ncbi:hypothetical protein LTR84_004690 [Exophiala bonariae]|uniref:Uncharacterized protein n=1 Tax=Exophiala bonariae TaxID=1690606 RepID=A0AAV9NN21_9EURO|nr:hypothetical protein LTR84_004690 [Exophiala bonariae]
MPSSEKANLQAHLNNQNQNQPRDLPPAYENTVLTTPTSRPNLTSGISNTSNTTLQPQHQPHNKLHIPSQNPLTTLSRLAAINLSAYGVRDAALSDDRTTLTTSKPELTSTQYALAKFIHDQASLPPKPLMVVRGTHASYSVNGGTAVDFELRLNLMGMLDLDTAPDFDGTGRSRIRVKAFQPTSGSSSTPQSSSSKRPGGSNSNRSTSSQNDDDANPLDAWIRLFTEDSKTKADNRTFTLTRVALNLPCAILEGQVRTLIAATKYRGKVTVEFPLLHRHVVVQRQNGNWFTNLLNITPTRKFDVVESVWTVGGVGGDAQGGFAGEGGSSGGGGGSSGNGNGSDSEGERNGRAGLVAQEWWKEWQGAIWNAVLAGRKGWVTVEDYVEARMGIREKEKGREWGVDHQS